jgi:uncharacterized protein YdeI (YjbR/CyaY-like superfamily)
MTTSEQQTGMSRSEIQPRTSARDRATWRRWLVRHHGSAREVWLVFARKHTREASIDYDEAVEEALCFGWIDGIKKTIDQDHYTYRFSPRKPGSAWSAINRKRAERLVSEGRMAPAGLAAVEEGRRSGAWARATKKRPDGMSDLLRDVLAADPEGRAMFEALPPGQRRLWNLYVNEAAREETRARRAREVLVRVRAGRRPGM